MNKTYKVTTHNTTLCKLNKSRGKMENIIASTPIASAIIGGISGWIGYKLNNSIKMKSEIEDSRIEWIQQVRSINLNIIKSSYQFIIETDSYIKSEKLLKDIEGNSKV